MQICAYNYQWEFTALTNCFRNSKIFLLFLVICIYFLLLTVLLKSFTRNGLYGTHNIPVAYAKRYRAHTKWSQRTRKTRQQRTRNAFQHPRITRSVRERLVAYVKDSQRTRNMSSALRKQFCSENFKTVDKSYKLLTTVIKCRIFHVTNCLLTVCNIFQQLIIIIYQ